MNNAGLEAISGATRPILSTPPVVEVQFIDLSPADQSRIKGWVLGQLPRRSVRHSLLLFASVFDQDPIHW